MSKRYRVEINKLEFQKILGNVIISIYVAKTKSWSFSFATVKRNCKEGIKIKLKEKPVDFVIKEMILEAGASNLEAENFTGNFIVY
jgi:hypothetical protein